MRWRHLKRPIRAATCGRSTAERRTCVRDSLRPRPVPGGRVLVHHALRIERLLRLVPNAIERYAIGDRTSALARDPDGGLTIIIAHAAPLDAAQRANWLPAPADRFFLCLRAYLPRPEMLDGRYRLPDPRRLFG